MQICATPCSKEEEATTNQHERRPTTAVPYWTIYTRPLANSARGCGYHTAAAGALPTLSTPRTLTCDINIIVLAIRSHPCTTQRSSKLYRNE